MVNLYIIDNYNELKNNGLNTYLSQLTKGITTHQKIKLNYIWINSSNNKDFEKISDNGVTHYHIQQQIYFYKEDSKYELMLVDFLAKEMVKMDNIIIHFNWINHCPLAWYLKQKINCKTVLTKHSIPWRGKREITLKMAQKLKNYFGIPAEAFLHSA